MNTIIGKLRVVFKLIKRSSLGGLHTVNPIAKDLIEMGINFGQYGVLIYF